jgi:hypothetical protein
LRHGFNESPQLETVVHHESRFAVVDPGVYFGSRAG